MPTPKQEKLIKLISENLGNPNSTESLGELMLKAGYSKSMSENPFQILESETIQEGLEEFRGMLDDKRRMAITHITKKKLEKSSAKDLANIVDVFTKNHQLLGGKETEKSKVESTINVINYGDNATPQVRTEELPTASAESI